MCKYCIVIMSLSKNNEINLEDFRVVRSKNVYSKVFTGRDRGRFVREQSRLDQIDGQYETVKIIIPEDIRSINPSFFEEMFVNVVKRHGRDEFLRKYHFKSLGDYNYEKPLTEAIERILRTNTAIG